jgi:hypothetical protein
MAMAAWVHKGVPSAGLYAGPLAWLVSLQAKYALVPWICANKLQLIHPVTLVSMLIGLAGTYVSWRAFATSPEPPPDRSGGGRPHRFVAAMGVLMSLLFTLVILLQGAAAFFLEGCER